MHGMLLPARGTSLSCLQTLRYVPCLHHITQRPKDKGQVRRPGLFFCADFIHLAEEIAETHVEEDGAMVFAGLAEDVGGVAEGEVDRAGEFETNAAPGRVAEQKCAHILGARRVQTDELFGIEASAKEWASGLREDKADAMVSHPGRA